MLIVMCQTTRYPAVFLSHSISVKPVVGALTQFISTFVVPNFTSHMFKQMLQQLGVKHNHASAYHAQSQGGGVLSNIEAHAVCVWYGDGEGLEGGAAMAHVGGQGSCSGKYRV